MRLLRLVAGVAIAAHGFSSSEWIFIPIGLYFAVLGILNLGCGSAACHTDMAEKPNSKTEEIIYEEVH